MINIDDINIAKPAEVIVNVAAPDLIKKQPVHRQKSVVKPRTHTPHTFSKQVKQIKTFQHPKQQSLESKFLLAFTMELIRAAKKERKFIRISHPVMDIQVPRISYSNNGNVTLMLQSKPTENKTISEVPRVILAAPKIPLRKTPITKQIKPVNWSTQGLPAPRPQSELIQQTSQYINQLYLDKVKNLLIDRSTFSVECPGPGRPLVIVSKGLASVTSTTISDEEINTFIKDISQKTRVPATPGLFKAVFGNLLIIAVISDFVGTRFIIQKRG